MSEPYYPAKAGDPILADTWNNLQIKTRDEIRAHTHSGGEDGKKINGNGIDPTSTVNVKELNATVKLTVNAVDVLGRLNGLANDKLDKAGGTLTGALTVNGRLQVPEGPIVPRWGSSDKDGILFPPNPGGGEADVAFMRYSVEGKTENTTLRIGIDNDAEDTLRLWQMGKDRLVIRNGNIGIGTTAPEVLLHLEQPRGGSGIRINSYTGKRYFELHFDQNDNFCFYYQHRELTGGLSGAGEWMGQTGGWNRFTASDASLKENVAELQGVLEKVLRLRPVSFDWKNTGIRDMGLIAQEVEQVFPQLVSETRSNETSHKGVAYSAFGLLAIAALQELKRQYDERLSVLERRHTHGAT